MRVTSLGYFSRGAGELLAVLAELKKGRSATSAELARAVSGSLRELLEQLAEDFGAPAAGVVPASWSGNPRDIEHLLPPEKL